MGQTSRLQRRIPAFAGAIADLNKPERLLLIAAGWRAGGRQNARDALLRLLHPARCTDFH